jgi:hypothetical protein
MSYFISDPDFRALCRQAGVREVAFPDARELYAYDVPDDFTAWIELVKPKKPHWFAVIQAADDEAAYSIEAQGKIAREQGEQALRDILQGFGLKPGFVKKREPQKVSELPANNPWHASYKGSAEAREARKLQIIKMGTAVAARFAHAAGVGINGQPLQKVNNF